MENGLITTEIDRLTTEILMLKAQTAQNIIEIGKRLIAVKESLPHGEWGKWLKEKVDFSHTSANRFMQVAREFSNSPTLVNLPPSKVFALLDLPAEERDNFVKSNPVNEMSTRELQQAIKERDQAVKVKEELELKLKTAEKEVQQKTTHYNNISESYKRLEETNKKHYEKAEQLRKELEETKKQLTAAHTSGNNEEVERLNGEIGRLSESLVKTDNELAISHGKIEELERQLKEKPIETAVATVEKIPDEVHQELEELRQKAAQQGSPTTLKFKVYFDELVDNFKTLLEVLAEIPENETERYKGAVLGLIGKMSERLI